MLSSEVLSKPRKERIDYLRKCYKADKERLKFAYGNFLKKLSSVEFDRLTDFSLACVRINVKNQVGFAGRIVALENINQIRQVIDKDHFEQLRLIFPGEWINYI